ncbi:hypothetical protein [Gluconobacter sp. DsW_058]|uniref:hypothetical protein n=1 Tax=Gluconobacter sp. DsW_058 TaxID=1511210 RepID=UPI000A390370|nr:hypothetical protein [Gluconobacter sp. DsW_058]
MSALDFILKEAEAHDRLTTFDTLYSCIDSVFKRNKHMLLWKKDYIEKSMILIEKYENDKNEHYWGKDYTSEVSGFAVGTANSVNPPEALEKLYDNPASLISIHHTHPDERALGYNDLELLLKLGVCEIWAYTPDFGVYGAKLNDHANPAEVREKLDKTFPLTNGMFEDYVASLLSRAFQISESDFDLLFPCSRMLAFESLGLIEAHIRVSNNLRQKCNFFNTSQMLCEWIKKSI